MSASPPHWKHPSLLQTTAGRPLHLTKRTKRHSGRQVAVLLQGAPNHLFQDVATI